MSEEKRQELEALAGEYVLGTLDDEERRAVEARLAREPQLARAIEDWQRRFQPLLDNVVPRTAPSGVLAEVLASINEKEAGRKITDVTQRLQGRLKLWRLTAFAASAIAAVLAIFIMRSDLLVRSNTDFISVLNTPEGKPAYVAVVDVGRKIIGLRRIADEPRAGSSYELWALGGGRDKPVSLGVIDSVSQISPKIFERGAGRLGDTTFAISLEPEGGSPTGQPTGAVLFTGKLLPASPPR